MTFNVLSGPLVQFSLSLPQFVVQSGVGFMYYTKKWLDTESNENK